MPAPSMVLTPPPPPAETSYSPDAPAPSDAKPPEEAPYNPFASAQGAAPDPWVETETAAFSVPATLVEARYEPPAEARYEPPTVQDEPPTLRYESPALLPEPTPQIPPPTQASRPSQEDLAALDALLHPASETTRAASERTRGQEKFEPQFRPPTAPARKPQARPPAAATRSRIPLIAAGLAGVALATVAAWYFLLRSPEPVATPRPTTPTTVAAVPTTTLPPPTLAASPPLPTPLAAPSTTPVPVATPPPPAATPTPQPAATVAPTPAATPRPAPTPAHAAPASGDGHDLLRQGEFAEAARTFAASLAPGARGRFSHQLLTACAPDTIAKAVQAVTAQDLFILPVRFQGRSCYRLCWGVYDNRAAAEAARASVPDYFRQGASPRLSPLHELLP
jgi:hypothetical protein